VGYAGGKTDHPTYRNLGDHTETVEIDFDPSVISYENLLDVFWESHDPVGWSGRRQYMSIVFYHDDEQKNAAIRSKDRESARRNTGVVTEILPASRFFLAEGYHQKYMLRNRPELMKEYEGMFPSLGDLLASTAVARVNGYVAGHGTCEMLRKEIGGLGLSPAGRKRLADIVGAHERNAGGWTGAACPME
jgi:methionine-S-sulfoxide reductase